jgi:hypothetical protein
MLRTDNLYRFHVVANSTAQASNGTFPFWFGCTVNATGVAASFFGLDGMSTGTFHSLDTAPRAIVTWYVSTGPVSTNWAQDSDTNLYARAWIAYGLGAAAFKRICMFSYGLPGTSGFLGGLSTANMSTGPYATEDQPLPLLTGRVVANGTLPGPKGTCSDIKMSTNTARSYPSTILNATNAYVYYGGLLVQWPESVSPSL